MADLFMIGGATDVMLTRLNEKFSIHKAVDMADPLATSQQVKDYVMAYVAGRACGTQPMHL